MEEDCSLTQNFEKGLAETEQSLGGMKTLCWNVPGLESSWAFQEARNEIIQINPFLRFLMQTKCNVSIMNKLKESLNYAGCLCVESDESRGGLELL